MPLSHWNVTTGDKFGNSSRLFRDKDQQYKHNFHDAVSLNKHLCDKFVNFGLILKICLATIASQENRVTFVRVSHDFPTNVAYFNFH